MVAANPNFRFPSDGSDPVPPVNRLAERVRHYFDRHPEPAREQRETGNGAGLAWPPLSAEEIRLHAWLTERLAVFHHERDGLWPRLRRLLFGNRLVRWLGL